MSSYNQNPPNNSSSLSDFSAKIKEVFVELKNYKFFHSPYSETLEDNRFIGRKAARQRIKNILRQSQTRSGSYLITGFRGMGKTSMVRQAIAEYNRENGLGEEKEKREKKKRRRQRASLVVKALVAGLTFVFLHFLFDELSAWYSIAAGFLSFVILALVCGVIWPLSGRSIAKLGWGAYTVIGVIVLFLGCFYYFLFPYGFCRHFNCFLPEFDLSVLYGKERAYLGIRLILGLVAFYIILSAVFFLYDGSQMFFYGFCRNKKGRGLGKERKRAPKCYEPFEINLSQDDLLEVDVLRRMTKALYAFWESKSEDYDFQPFARPIYFLWNLLLRSLQNRSAEKRVTYSGILNELGILNKRLIARVTSQNELEVNPSLTLGLIQGLGRLALPLGKASSVDQAAYPIANAKEIEDELIRIFKQIERFSAQNMDKDFDVPYFLFIIDELDKIEPYTNPNIQEQDASGLSLDNLDSAPGTNKIRQRQEAVARLLANLKGFLNVVRAKFFFIGGREMFDASLADIADRDSFYSSIFNDVIYINSFFKDKVEVRAGVTQMTEAYLCKVIMADLEKDFSDNYNLKKLSRSINRIDGEFYMDESILGESGNGRPSDIAFKACKYKILFLLQNYIIYLNYRSNGTPKKLASLIENNIRNGSIFQAEGDKKGNKASLAKNHLVLYHKDKSRICPNHNGKQKVIPWENRLFLRFKFDFQYEIGLTANLYRPYLIANSRHIKSLGDKLLFSSAFIIDHILKFHPFGFSWRHLEMIPEVILVNKEPNLRRFVEELIRFLSYTHIRSTVSGIFQYKFYIKVSKELTYLSKTSDLGSAAFNFTLDESLQIKRHYKRKLVELRNKYDGYKPIPGDNLFVHSMCFVQTILGDLYFYDKEYDEAVVYYTESIQTLRLPRPLVETCITRHQFYLWLRNKLKLGLALEKMRAFNSAFSHYRNLTLELEKRIRCVITEEEPGLGSVDIRSDGHRTMQMLFMPFVAYLGVIEKMRSDGITYADLKNQYHELEEVIRAKYKKRKGSGQDGDHYRRSLLLADYFNNMGSILFYKNCHFRGFYTLSAYNVGELPNPLVKQMEKQYDNHKMGVSGDKANQQGFDFQPSLSSLAYYLIALGHLLKYHRKRMLEALKNRRLNRSAPFRKKEYRLSLAPVFLLPECVDFINSDRFYYLGNIVSKIGDAILGSLANPCFLGTSSKPLSLFGLVGKDKSTVAENVLQAIKQLKEAENVEKPGIFTMENVILFYELAGAFYLRGGRVQNYAFQYKKILYLIKDVITFYGNRENTEDPQSNGILGDKEELKWVLGLSGKTQGGVPFRFVEDIAVEIFRSVTWNYNISNRPQILKYRDIFEIDNHHEDRPLIYNSINHSSEIRETILLVEEIKLKLANLGIRGQMEIGTLDNYFISPYSTINSRFARILEMKYRCEWYFFLVKKILKMRIFFRYSLIKDEARHFQPLIEHLKEEGPKAMSEARGFLPGFEKLSMLGLLQFLIKEAIFCLRELIKMVKLYEPGYVVGYSYLAAAHRKMGAWCQGYVNLKFLLSFAGGEQEGGMENGTGLTIKEELEELIGSNALMYLEPNYHYEEAIQNYYRAIQMHTEGRAYKAHVLNLYALEDDYNDQLTHFSLASERLRVNIGDVRRRINELKEKAEGSHIYQYDSYYPVKEKGTPKTQGAMSEENLECLYSLLKKEPDEEKNKQE